LHHRNLIGDELHDRQVVGNEEIGQVAALLQFVEEVENLRLYGHVHCRDAFVANKELRFHGEGSGHAKALALSAGKFVRITKKMRGREPDFLEERNHPFATIGRSGADLVNRERFGESLFDGKARV
jgi:hypothetical protein